MMDAEKTGRRERTAARVGGSAFLVTGLGHITLASLLTSTGDVLAVERQMEQTRFSIPPGHSIAELMQGFSVAMSVLLVASGVSVLLMTRRGRVVERTQLALMLVLSLALLATAVLLLPAPPIVLMSVASVAFAVAWGASRGAGTRHSAGTIRIDG